MPTKADIDAAWNRAATIRGKAPDQYRRDELGNELYKPSYGTHGEKGWHLDHRNPKANGGTDHGRNLRILHWQANLRKGDKV